MATVKVWKGFLSFGLLNVPVYLSVAGRNKTTELHNYHLACNSQIKQPKYCPTCEVMLQTSEIFRGFEGPKGIVPITNEEIEGLKPITDKQMEIMQCVPLSEIDPLYFAESFYLVPEAAGTKAYGLINRVLADTNTAAVVQLTKSGRENIGFIRARGNGLVLHYSWYADELNENAEFDSLQAERLSSNEIKLATQLVESLKSSFQPEEFEDGYRQRLNTLIASKLDKTVSPPPSVKVPQQNASADITEALMASLAVGKKPAQTIEKKTAKKGKRVAA